MDTNLLLLLLTGAAIGGSSSYLGSFMVVKRMSLVGDALSHVALPGIAIAMILNINPILGAFVALTIATIGIWYLSEHSEVYTEALVGVFFTFSLALGLLLTPEPELLEALFGNIDTIGILDTVFVLVGALIIFLVTRVISTKLLLGIVSEDLAKSQKINTSFVNLIYLFLVGLVVAMGIKFLGTLLTGAMVIIPAASAKNFSGGIKQFQIYSIMFGVGSFIAGLLMARFFNTPSGPIIVLTSVLIFVVSYIFKK